MFRFVLFLLITSFVFSCSFESSLSTDVGTAPQPSKEFSLVENKRPVSVWVDLTAPEGLNTVAGWFAGDLERLSGQKAALYSKGQNPEGSSVLVGVLGSGGLIDELVKNGKIDPSSITGQKEASITQVVESPKDGAGRALVVAGTDKRGAIYGLLELSRENGVSPWYWWADVPTKQQENILISAEPIIRNGPKVRFRGIFINDEAPALANWSQEKFGGANSKFYAHVYELILRQRANYLWPAMWGRSLMDDDPESQRLADELGVVLGTTHHEPMHKAHVEWQRYGEGPWDYNRNPEKLREFWRDGIERMGNYESLVTIGMRGDGDEPMSEAANIAVLEKVVADQRAILSEKYDDKMTEVPQLWALYKEVQEYYDKGMKVPDDVILLLCDDNWGNVRRLPRPDQVKHPGGYGMYYHFDYVGGPRNYKWINTSPLPRVWEQMNLSWQHGVDQIWIVNVGDLKPMEHPIDFFLDMAWDPDAFPAESINEKLETWKLEWSEEQFGQEYASEIANLIASYTKINGRRKPELLDANTYSHTAHNEWDTVVNQWHDLVQRAEKVEDKLPETYQSAYYQLVLHPILASANLNEMYMNVAKNLATAAEEKPSANDFADQVESLYQRDQELTQRYHSINGGKWNHMMSQTHIGYTYWQQPEEQVMPEVKRVEISGAQIPDSGQVSVLPVGNNQANALKEIDSGAVGFVELDGVVSMDAENFSKAVGQSNIQWQVLSDHGRTGSAITAIPVNVTAELSADSPHLEYQVHLVNDGAFTLDTYLSPTLDFYGADESGNNLGLRFAVSLDGDDPVIVDMHADGSTPEHDNEEWGNRVANNIHILSIPFSSKSGNHTLKFWRIDPGVVLQKLVIRRGEKDASYLGPPESPRVN